MTQALFLERDLGIFFPDGNQTFYNSTEDRKVTMQQITSVFGMQRSVNISSRVGYRLDGEPIYARIMGLLISENQESLTVGVPDDTEGYVYTSHRYKPDGTRGGIASGLSFGIGIDVQPMRDKMRVNGHYALAQLPERIDYPETVRRFIEQVTQGDYDSIPVLIPSK